MEDVQTDPDPSWNVTLMLQRAVLVDEKAVALMFARLWVAVRKSAKLLSSNNVQWKS